MKDRILSKWTFTRVLYVIMGIVVIIQSVMSKQWLGIGFGAYFTAMGVFAFGCAAGNCFGGNCKVTPKPNTNIHNTDFEEVK